MTELFDTTVIAEVVETSEQYKVNNYLKQGWLLLKVGTTYHDYNTQMIYYSLGRPKEVSKTTSK